MARYYTPLRYPGGKSKVSGFIKALFEENDLCDGQYVEPYAGGAGIAMELLLTGYAEKVHLNDLNFPVYCFWESIKNNPDELCKRIQDSKITIESWKQHKAIIQDAKNHAKVDVGFSLLFLNRSNRSGIINAGVIGGENQSGAWKMDARFNKAALIDRITQIAQYRNYIEISNLDAMDFLFELKPRLPKRCLIYLDPPYFKQGRRLYDNFYQPKDHAKIAKEISKNQHRWLVSYDDASEIRDLYRNFKSSTHYINYSAGKAYKGREIFFFSDNLKIPDKVKIFSKEGSNSMHERLSKGQA